MARRAIAVSRRALFRADSPSPSVAAAGEVAAALGRSEAVEKAAEGGIALPSLKKALVSGEAFPPSLRDWLRERGVEGYQAYATADVGTIAYETAAREGLGITVVLSYQVAEAIDRGEGHVVDQHDGEFTRRPVMSSGRPSLSMSPAATYSPPRYDGS